jgi:hypothetical protein
MKKIITLAVAAFLITGAAFAGEGKNCGSHKGCCKKGAKEMTKKAEKPAPTAEVKKA